MINISNHVYKDGEKFYFDSENYDGGSLLSIDFEDGDIIKWIWEGVKMMGTLRQEGYDLGLFVIEDISTAR
jgi:hypothetical protein